MTKVIINADDFGYSKAVNLGIIEAFQNGIVTSSTLMVNMPGAEHAASLAKENPSLGVGIHLVLTCGCPVNPNVTSLINRHGEFHRIDTFYDQASAYDIEAELNSQVEKFLSLGLEPTHIDSHHHIHAKDKVFSVVEKLASQMKIPIRKLSNEWKNKSMQTVEYFNPEFYGVNLNANDLSAIIDKCLAYESAEIMCHPAFLDEAILSGSSYTVQRCRELATLTDKEIFRTLLDKNVNLITYKDLLKG
jgi:chitin disaccharide deacetylase